MPSITTLLIQSKTTPVGLNPRHWLLKWNASTRTMVSDREKHIKMNLNVDFIKSNVRLIISSYCVNYFNFNVSISLGICIPFAHLFVCIWFWISVFCTDSISWFGLAHVATCCQKRMLMNNWLDRFSERPAGWWQYTNFAWGFCYLGNLFFRSPVGCLVHWHETCLWSSEVDLVVLRCTLTFLEMVEAK